MTKILVIEDEQAVRENITELLATEGYEIVAAENGHVGITWAWEHKPDLILCDVMMPELDGYEVLKLLREEPTTALMPFIFLSAKADKTHLRQGMELGADDYLTKPFSKKDLLGAIAARLKKQTALRQPEPSHDEYHGDRDDVNIFVAEFLSLKSAQVTGRLSVTCTSGDEWIFYLYSGRVLYATGGVHPIRRWQRHIVTYCPQISLKQMKLPTELAGSAWEYQVLGLWLKQQQISSKQVTQILRSSITEVLFDILQTGQVVKYQVQVGNPLGWQLLLVDVEQALAIAYQQLHSWQHANLEHISPNKAPTLKQPELLQQKTSATTYRQLTALLDGRRTLRDLAVLMKRQVLELSYTLLPYLQDDMVELADIPDLPMPAAEEIVLEPPVTPIALKPTIACIDDSPLVCEVMRNIITDAGYQFIDIQDPLRALAILLSQKPDMIFLDLIMPKLNGYEICTRIRRINAFRDTPIVILSGNLIDRVRAMVVGASDCLDKPVQADAVVKLIHKHLSASERST
ncbi:response regulator [Chroococcidiopsis sp. FACHB-1243]|uniref:response regulator transcription factor n=1 Tax=Chroococcidiopsis sp. [FACHB-1243] TaxID=2692781 RepID=UPI00177FC080|nr:response regulator [Chroococcidiopsis sp. [FACHB-1243]]MBD2303976.1 response regulator [Chroococcidiopsis sp. [FACHB-1243]]